MEGHIERDISQYCISVSVKKEIKITMREQVTSKKEKIVSFLVILQLDPADLYYLLS